jgi:triosephosphate isomerase
MIRINLPCIIVNFKCYVYGEKALKLAKICKEVSEKTKVSIGVCPQYVDIAAIAKFKLPVITQHVDPITQGAYTGHVSIMAVKQAGATGTLINHSERRLKLEQIKQTIKITKKLKLVSIVCVANIFTAKKVASFKPDFIAYEPPELIGSGRAVSKVKPKVVKKFVDSVEKINPKIIPLCGAGITNDDDVARALELGTKGILVSSAIVKARNPKRILEGFAKTINKSVS